MPVRFFLDTNIFVYSFDEQEPHKRERALELIRQALLSGDGIISTQVVQEFLNVATRKFAVPMTADEAREYLRQVLNPLCQIYPDLSLYETCLDIQAETGYSFYDSLILAASIKGECDILYSEDLQDGHQVHGVRIVNPFT